MSDFISATELQDVLKTAGDTVLLDLRFDPGKGSDRSRFESGHLPDARYVELETVFADPEAETLGLLPKPEELEPNLRALGLDNGTSVIVYDDTSGGPSARAWWVLKWAGATQVRVLDGGLSAWAAAGGEITETVPQDARPGTFTVNAGQLASVDADAVAALLEDDDTVLIDTRAAEAFRGSPASERTGHIPGAINLPQNRFRDERGGVVGDAELGELLDQAGATGKRVVLYCGAGISSAYAALALHNRAEQPTLYPGSFSDWARSPERPVEQQASKPGAAGTDA